MVERINHPKWGQPRRRVFRDVAWDAKLEQDLQSAADTDSILEFQREENGLVVFRPWVDGSDVCSFFSDATFIERRDHSRDLFAAVIDQLGERAHGAIHPDNMRKIGEKLVLFDWVANAARLRTVPESTVTYDIWLWQPCSPPGWKARDWDRVNLLRMAALLAKGPPWEAPLPFLNMIQLCRFWAEEYIRDLTVGDDLESELKRALRLLETIQPTQLAPPPTPPPELEKLAELEEHLETLFRKRGNRILYLADEKLIDQRFGTDASLLLAVALRLLDAEKQEDVKKAAKAFLDAGVYEKSRIVRSSACRNAERLFVGLGVPFTEAEELVKQLLASERLKDSRAVQNDWALEVEQFLQKHCGRQRQYSRRQFSKMVKLVTSFHLPEPWAKVQLRQYLDQSSASIKPSFFGF
jgi:hypothetical protein